MRRRRYLYSALLCSTALAGCGSSNQEEDSGETGSDENKSSSTDNGQENPDDNEKDEKENGPDNDWSPNLYFNITERQEPQQDFSLEVSFSYNYGTTEPRPAAVDIYLRNTAEEPRTLEFQGYVPFPSPRGTQQEGFTLLLLPTFEDTRLQTNEIPAYEREQDYWELTEPFEAPNHKTSLTLDPGETIGGKHVIVTPEGHIARASDENQFGPRLGDYSFESTATVMQSAEESLSIDYGFTVFAGYEIEN